MVVWGSGGTLRLIGQLIGHELTLLGIDIQHQNKIHADLNEQELIKILSSHNGEKLLLISNGRARIFDRQRQFTTITRCP